MNQAIQFPDREVWDENSQTIRFPVLVGGFQRECAIGGSAIQQRYGGENAEQWLALFHAHRWDLEEEFERLVRDEADDADGRFVIY